MPRAMRGFLFLIALVAIGFFVFPPERFSQSKDSRSFKFFGKGMSTLHAEARFQWLDSSKGEGIVSINFLKSFLRAENLSLTCKLPDDASTNDDLERVIASPIQGESLLEFKVGGLKKDENQNIVCKMNSLAGSGSAIALVIPTNYEQTLEFKMAQKYSPGLRTHSLKSSDTIKRLPARIQF
ncbi:MAG: hypothetical protein RJB66_584 [Pseudomonadota bacterium]|jgi:hypothetical protein